MNDENNGSRNPNFQHHRGGVLTVKLDRDFGIVPVAILEDKTLGFDSRVAAAWLATRPNGWQISVFNLRNKLDVTKGRWWKMARELEAGGYLSRRCMAGGGPRGQFAWEIIFTAIPEMNEKAGAKS